MDAIHLWLPVGPYEQELIIPRQFISEILVASAVHEAAHIVAAHHLGGVVVGIAISQMPGNEAVGLFVNAIYGFESFQVDSECLVKAAGPAAEILFQGACSEITAREDVLDIEKLTGTASLEPYLTRAMELLRGHELEVKAVAAKMRENLGKIDNSTLGPLPNGWRGVLLVGSDELGLCLKERATARGT
jgi:hypothetical protein